MSLPIEDRIQFVAEGRTPALMLDGLGLDSIPSAVFELNQLELLSCAGNRLRTIPEEVCRLPKLRVIRADRNLLREFPAGLLLNPAVKEIGLPNNQVESIPSPSASGGTSRALDSCVVHAGASAGKAPPELRLEVLDLHGNMLKELPWFIEYAPRLRVVCLDKNRIDSVNLDRISHLHNLDVFLVAGNPCCRAFPKAAPHFNLAELAKKRARWMWLRSVRSTFRKTGPVRFC